MVPESILVFATVAHPALSPFGTVQATSYRQLRAVALGGAESSLAFPETAFHTLPRCTPGLLIFQAYITYAQAIVPTPLT